MLIVQNNGMKRPRKLEAQVLIRCSLEEKASFEEAVDLLREDDPEMDFSKWARMILRKGVHQVRRKKAKPAALVGKTANEVPSAEPETLQHIEGRSVPFKRDKPSDSE